MRKTLLTAMLLCMALTIVWAVPALREAVRMQQPDGTCVTIVLHGDEYLHFTTTDDGYSVVKNPQGYYVYARLDGGQLVATDMVAHDRDLRSTAERAFTDGLQKYTAPEMTDDARRWKADEQARQARARAVRKKAQYDYSNFRGLLILVEFNDKSFSRTDFHDIIDNMVNQQNYTGYVGTNGRKVTYSGSVRDYFSDNSMGLFQPEFDVYGPYQINYSQYYAQGTQRAATLVNAAVNAADADIDFSEYDGDGDGMVDMIYFIFAGNGSNYGGNDERLYWPHRSVIYNPQTYRWVQKDGVYLYDYASSVELYGYTAYPSSVTIDGIGTICHEFGHVLGLPDFYDADYEGSGGESNHPDKWSVMAGGSYENYGRTPVGYTLLERSFVGFTEPMVLSEAGDYQLQNLSTVGNGYRLNTRVNNEYFLLENRQTTTKWDRYLPGHGLLITRVEENQQVWDGNTVNNNPNHNYYEVVRAKGGQGATGSDPFPGTGHVTEINNNTAPANLRTWAGTDSPFGISNIKEQSGTVSFTLEDVNILTSVTLPQEASVNVGFSMQLTETRIPDYAPYELTWESDNPDVATVSQAGLVTGVAVGQAHITVKAVNSQGTTLSDVCLVTVSEAVAVNSISELKELDVDAEAMLNVAEAQVLYAHQGDVYLRDGSGSLVLSGINIDLTQGDLLRGALLGRYSVADSIPRLRAVEGVDYSRTLTVNKAATPEPRPLVLTDKTNADYADYVVLQSVQLERVTTGLSGVYAVDGDVKVRLYNTFGLTKGITMPSNYTDKFFDVPGILVTRRQNGVLYDELALLGSAEEVAPSAISNMPQANDGPTVVYSLDGRQVSSGSQRQRGLYIVRRGDRVRLERR